MQKEVCNFGISFRRNMSQLPPFTPILPIPSILGLEDHTWFQDLHSMPCAFGNLTSVSSISGTELYASGFSSAVVVQDLVEPSVEADDSLGREWMAMYVHFCARNEYIQHTLGAILP